ncbi:NAD(P)H-dependent oxidoreductase [Clostridiaceae bacterium UIB06]|uniref:NAD(P)H-dependent oxidoreductase n=1 Tax=Clostridium thailandense TaxID=2794346 RepID=A0A949WQS6_9CLOT|nr:NAD(P)H-dependent oxidoreductase [Clostridium thailandense]MBV7273126.1 NAD(P)H-dependent oxidoreductase [Clostridium thailandense]MCH5137548.1 NAD(P)H-dependent oxidoreductase [Clostridiaceae bacterium UIB06]
MNHLIIYAHPSTNSFSNAILDELKECSMKKNCRTEVRDLYSIGFDPVLRAADFEGICGGKTPEDIKREHGYIKWADLITFIYPIWWTGMPAILKGYIDRVFSCELVQDKEKDDQKDEGGSEDKKEISIKESNDSEENSKKKSSNDNEKHKNSEQTNSESKNKQDNNRALLKGKRVLIVNTMGTPNETYDNYGMINSMKQTSDIGIFSFCGMEVVQHKFFGDVPNVSDDLRKKYLNELKDILEKVLS